MGFVKFGMDNEDNEDVEVTEENETPSRKRKCISPKENAKKPGRKRRTDWVDHSRRKAKDVDYKECKDDLNHLFYIKIKAQKRVRHVYLPDLNVNLNAVEDLMDLPKNMYPHCTMAEVRPIYYAKKHCKSLDVCFSRTLADSHYKLRMSNARTRYLNTWNSSRQIRKLAKEDVYHSLLFTIAERLESNPDPFFYGNYDFYYTGGNLCTLSNASTHNVVHVDHNELETLKISTYPRSQYADSGILQEFTSIQLPSKGEIFEISSLRTMNDVQNVVAARQLNNITLLKIDPNKNKVKLLVEFKTCNTPLISSAQSLERPDLFVVSTMKQSLRVYDISHSKRVALKRLCTMEQENGDDFTSSWNRIMRWHAETFLYADEHKLMLADFRTRKKDWLKTECKFSPKEYPCEFNTSLALSEFEHLFYIGTTHKLRCLDARYLTQPTHYEQATVCEWTHQLDYPPAFLDVYRHETREYVACASQVAGDLRVCELTQSKHLENTGRNCAFESHCLPWQPPTLQEAYDSACFAGKLLQPETGLKQRIRACTTGLGFLKTEDNNSGTQAVLMYANSHGDVYAQSMKQRLNAVWEERTTAKGDAVIEEFAKNLCEIPQPPLNYTDVVNMKVMRSVFSCAQLNDKVTKLEKSDTNIEQQQADAKDSTFKRSKGRWRKSMATLHSYKDALVPDLLSIWDIPCEDETDIKYSALQNKFKNEKSEKDILNWLNVNDVVQPTTTIPMSNLNFSTMDIEMSGFEIQAQSTQILTSDLDVSLLNTSNLMDSSNLVNTSRISISKPKASKSKKKHVKGF